MSQIRVGYCTVTSASNLVRGEYRAVLSSVDVDPDPFEVGETLNFTGGDTGVCTYWDAAASTIYYYRVLGSPDVGDTVTGATSAANGVVDSIDQTVDWVVEDVDPADLFAITQVDNDERLVDYTVGGTIASESFLLSSVYAGSTAYHQTYFVHTSFTADLGIPYLEAGDVGVRVVTRAAAKMINEIFKDVNGIGLGAPFTGNALKSIRVNAGETALEKFDAMPVDASRDFSAQVKVPLATPTHPQHLANKYYTDATFLPLSGGNMTKNGTLYLCENTIETDVCTYGAVDGLRDSKQSWVDDQWNGYWVRCIETGDARLIQDTIASVQALSVTPNWTAPQVGDTYEIYDGAEDREAARLEDVSDLQTAVTAQIAAAQPFGAFWEEQDDFAFSAGTELDFSDLTALEIYGADGSRLYEVSITVVVAGTTANDDDCFIRLYQGTTGDKGDTLIGNWPVQYANVNNTHYDTAGVARWQLPAAPAAGQKLGLAVYCPTRAGRVLGEAGSLSGLSKIRTHLTLEQVLRRTS
jgi:hypothetical protein